MTREDAQVHAVAMSQSKLLGANERMRRNVPCFGFKAADRAPFVCECTDPGSSESVMLSLDEYDRLRTHPVWFVVVAGHEDDAANECVVRAEHGYLIVEKVGLAGQAARRQARADGGTG